nr:9393_t:CDS:2 [Entrophospora candida]
MKYNFKVAATCQYPSKNNSKIDSTSDSMTMIDLEQQMRPPPQQQQLINSVNTNKLVQTTARISNTTENKINNNDIDNNNDYTTIHNIIPNLMSEKEKKAKFVEKLVDMTCLIINVIWAELSVNPNTKVIPLKIFVRETLRRSRTSYSTLQATLFYLFRIKPQIDLITANANGVNQDNQKQQKLLATSNNNNNNPATCCRRMFLAALIVASKYLQDCNYSNSAWSKISGLPVGEINANEICFLQLIDYNLFISEDIFRRWSSFLLKHIQDTLHNEILKSEGCYQRNSNVNNRNDSRIMAN